MIRRMAGDEYLLDNADAEAREGSMRECRVFRTGVPRGT